MWNRRLNSHMVGQLTLGPVEMLTNSRFHYKIPTVVEMRLPPIFYYLAVTAPLGVFFISSPPFKFQVHRSINEGY